MVLVRCGDPVFSSLPAATLRKEKSRNVGSSRDSRSLDPTPQDTMLCRLVVLLALSGADALKLGAAASRRSFITKVKLPKEFRLHIHIRFRTGCHMTLCMHTCAHVCMH